MPRFWPTLLVCSLPLLVWSCPSDEICSPRVVTSEEECSTTNDCVEAGYKSLVCVSGQCKKTCYQDSDCKLEKATEEEQKSCENPGADPSAVCEAQLCVVGCPDVPCERGQCVDGRCAVFFESFEIPEGQGAVDLIALGWNSTPRELGNTETKIVWIGIDRCPIGDDRCAGVASHGDRFLVLEEVPTPERGTPDVGPTCRSCACCLECILEPPSSGSASVPNCPVSSGVPVASTCPTTTPAPCTAVCNDCAQCTGGDAGRIGDRLLACERTSAEKTCSPCPQCDTCTASNCPVCGTGSATDCEACQAQNCPSCEACLACSDAIACELTDPGTSECLQKRSQCDAQGNDGCYPTPIHYPRAQLTDLEQALESPEITLSGVSGNLVLQFEYVPFNVAEKYRRGEQGTPASQWPLVDQEVVVQLCAADCATPSSWKDAEVTSGGRASFPPASRRRNGLSLGSQSGIDWRNGRLEVAIPETFRTGTFRFRFLPRLDKDTRVGIDNVMVRVRP